MATTEKSSRKLSLYIIAIVLIVWIYSIWSHRVTPITSIARVHSYLVRIAPEVSGNCDKRRKKIEKGGERVDMYLR